MMRGVAVVGLGYAGLPTAVVLLVGAIALWVLMLMRVRLRL